MWTETEASQYINDEVITMIEEGKGDIYQIDPSLTETWENGWVLTLVLINGEGYHIRYIVEKHLMLCRIVGTSGVQRAIENLYRFHERHNNLKDGNQSAL